MIKNGIVNIGKKRWMVLLALFTIHCSLFISPIWAQVGTWKAYMAYREPQQIVKAGNHLFVRASNGLYQYNLNDQSITTYDKTRQLNDTHISMIAWNDQAKRLIVVYDNSNIDLVDLQGNVRNISGLYSKSMTQSKTINCIYMYQHYAYIGAGFGVMKVNMERAEISESYILNHNVINIGVADETLYVRTSEKADISTWETVVIPYQGSVTFSNPAAYGEYVIGVFAGPLDRNLIDKHNWSLPGSYPGNVFQEDNSDWDDNIELVKTLNPDGPKYNHFGFMRFKNNKLYTVGGGGNDLATRPATVQIKDGDEWIFLQDDMTGVEGTGGSWTFVEMYSVDVDPFDSKHIFAAGRTGLFEYYDGALVKYYNKDNSILKTATTSNRYVLVFSNMFDAEGNLWLLQSEVENNSIVELTKDGEWISHYQSLLMEDNKSLKGLVALYQDSRGLIWFTNKHWGYPSFYCYNPKTNEIERYMTKLVNQDGITGSEWYNPCCIVEDKDGNLWLGTNAGLYMIDAASASSGSLEYVTQVKVPRNDGTNYADYLLAGISISAIAVDGGNRKWIGTVGQGIYLISADNMEQIYHFTTDNSPLLSNSVEAIAIDHSTGEVFIGTEEGLCSYMSDAIESAIEMVKDDVYAYPNPVVKGYEGLITVVGLTRDADVKILTVNGQLVAQGRSNGGAFTWDGCDRSGRRVASGVYMVATATSDGKKGVVCKIAVIN